MVRSKSVVVSGRVSDNRKVAFVTVNGRPAKVTNGKFTLKKFLLRQGPNTITFKATDGEGNVAIKKVTVTRTVGGTGPPDMGLALEKVLFLLKEGVFPKRVADHYIAKRGVKFALTEDVKSKLIAAGADSYLIQSLQKLLSSPK